MYLQTFTYIFVIIKCSYFPKIFSKTDPNLLKRISIIEGSLDQPDLGLGRHILNDLVSNTQIVLHSAADVRFDIDLLYLINVNLKGTKYLLDVFNMSKNLEIFIYISTSYSHSWRLQIDDHFYEAPLDPQKMIELAGKITDGASKRNFEILTARIIKPWPNNYAYSKALSEELVRTYGKQMCVAVMRPSIGMQSLKC